MKKLSGLFICFVLIGLCGSAQSTLDKKISALIEQLACAEPDEITPVTLNAGVLTEMDSVAFVVKLKLASGWHIYGYVPPTMPYINMEPILKLPEGLQGVGDWKKSQLSPSVNDPGVMIYENKAWLVHKAVHLKGIEIKGPVEVGLYYQACNLQQCLPPTEKTFELKVAAMP